MPEETGPLDDVPEEELEEEVSEAKGQLKIQS